MSIGIINIILLLAAAQGILLAFLIFHKHRQLFANRFLATLMLLLSITLLYLLLSELGYYKLYPFLMLLLSGIPLIINPLLYFYAKYLVLYSENFKKTDWLHFVPFLVYELSLIPVLFSASSEIIAVFDNVTNQSLHPRFIIFNWAILIQGSSYIVVILFILKKYSSSIQNVFSTIDKMRLDWLRNIIIIVGFTWIIFLMENIFYLTDIQFYKIFDVASVFAAILVYSIGYMGLLKSEVFEHPEFIESYKYASLIMDKSDKNSESGKKYEKSGLSAEMAKKYLDKLLELMNEKKPYLNSNLTLNQLADKLSISPHNLSEVINTQLNQNFFDFVNQYRVEKVKKDLLDSKKQNLTFLSIGLDAGFNSKSSFNAIFKKHTGKTPSEFRKIEYKSY